MHHYVQFTETCKIQYTYRFLIINRPTVTDGKQTTSPVTYGDIYLTIESPIINVSMIYNSKICKASVSYDNNNGYECMIWHSSIYRGFVLFI